MDPDSWIRIQDFLCGPQIRIGSVPCITDPLLRIQLGCKHSSCVKGIKFKASGGPEIPCPEFLWTTVFSRGSGPKTPIPFYGISPECVQTGWSLHFRPAHAFGGVTGMPWMPDWPMNAVRLRFIRYVRFLWDTLLRSLIQTFIQEIDRRIVLVISGQIFSEDI
jgi:hypothetical protein